MNAVSRAGTRRTREGAGRTSGVGQFSDAGPTQPEPRSPEAVDTAHTTSQYGNLLGGGILTRHSGPVKATSEATSEAGTPAGDGRKTRRVDRSRGGRPAPAVPRCSPFLGEPFRGRTRG
jgi:hypothetical protein